MFGLCNDGVRLGGRDWPTEAANRDEMAGLCGVVDVFVADRA